MEVSIKLKKESFEWIARFLHEPYLGVSVSDRRRALSLGNVIAQQLSKLREEDLEARKGRIQ